MTSLDSRKSVEASRMGSSLVAAFHRASPPLIWRFDLERNHSFTLALQGDENDWELGLTSSKGEFYPVAKFLDHDDAEEAFIKVERALAKRPQLPMSRATKIILGILVVAAVIGGGLVASGSFIRSNFPQIAGQTPTHTQTHEFAITPPAPKKIESGVPLSADDFLRPPSQ